MDGIKNNSEGNKIMDNVEQLEADVEMRIKAIRLQYGFVPFSGLMAAIREEVGYYRGFCAAKRWTPDAYLIKAWMNIHK